MTAGGLRGFRVYLEMIKIEHSIFALPFAMLGMIWAANGWPGWHVFMWILVAMVSCRSSAMAFNRIADREVDAKNTRTMSRALPAGLLSLKTANLYFLGSCVIFVLAASQLNRLSFALAPVALIVTLGYSLSKRFTPLCHFILGLSLGIAPAAAWVAVRGTLSWTIVPVSAGVMLWTAGFDLIYSLQDEEFDRDHALRSLPQTVGKSKALTISRTCHVAAIIALAIGGFMSGSGFIFYVGLILSGLMLGYEQSLVSPNDLSKVNIAFFTMNGFVSIGVFGFALIDLIARH